MAVEVGACLVAVLPGTAYLGHGVPDPWMSLKPIAEAPGSCRGGSQSSALSPGSRWTPLRKYVIVAPYFLPTARKCEKSRYPSSPAPSQEKTTNCGGFPPGLRPWGRGWYGCAPEQPAIAAGTTVTAMRAVVFDMPAISRLIPGAGHTF
ncbi:hypothetical protein GCM10010211_41990 [Streptomyces albospinus]|uniref:Secreted protein n=1 Tax=Streptomyces albospinus TaxID=285515 RepID=A0ABQ2V6P3_9ACTN|nr:hypothetical protein GCM10010211_41990 [Streptomyces albospinus]